MWIRNMWMSVWSVGQTSLAGYDATFDPRYGRPLLFDPARSGAQSTLFVLLLFKVLVSVAVLLPLTIVALIVMGVVCGARALRSLGTRRSRPS